MKIQFQIRPSPDQAFPWECRDLQFEIGRGAGCKLRFQDENASVVSGRHALVELTPAGAFLTDLKSTNGTYLNGTRVHGRSALRVGDQIQLGQAGPKLDLAAIDLPPELPPATPASVPIAVSIPAPA